MYAIGYLKNAAIGKNLIPASSGSFVDRTYPANLFSVNSLEVVSQESRNLWACFSSVSARWYEISTSFSKTPSGVEDFHHLC
jgi:hypothetical protein